MSPREEVETRKQLIKQNKMLVAENTILHLQFHYASTLSKKTKAAYEDAKVEIFNLEL